jgi:hypothetical protein
LIKGLFLNGPFFNAFLVEPAKGAEIQDHQNLSNLAFAFFFGLKLKNSFVD